MKLTREQRRALLWKEPTDMTLDELAALLSERYAPTEIPPCPECGAALTPASMGGGEPDVWACSHLEEDPEDPGHLRVKAGRRIADRHYDASRFVDRRRGGDELVMELVRRATGRCP